ncbi:unnamed protein product, partial [Ixodes hexagonus]
GRLRLYLALSSACMAALSFGLTLGYSSPALPDIRRRMAFSDSQEDLFGSLVNIGALFGGLAGGGQLVNKIGRKDTILLAGLGFVLGFLLIEMLPVPGLMFAGRALTGFSAGITALVLTIFVSEVSPAHIRGILNTVCAIAITSGVLMANVLGKWLGYRWLATACMVPTVLNVLTMPKVAESPRWLFQEGRVGEAMRSLQFYEGADAEESFEALRSSSSTSVKLSLAHFKLPQAYKSFLCVLLGMYLQQFSGITIMLYYTREIFKTAGSTIESADSAIIVGVVQVTTVLLTTFLVDRLGRKMLLLFSCGVTCLSLAALGAFYHLKDNLGPSFVATYGWLPLIALCTYMMGYSMGLGPQPWTLMGEMLPLNIKGFATGILTAFSFGCGALISREYHAMIQFLGNDGLYWFYGAHMALGFVLVLLFIPETKGKTLEEIEVSFGR